MLTLQRPQRMLSLHRPQCAIPPAPSISRRYLNGGGGRGGGAARWTLAVPRDSEAEKEEKEDETEEKEDETEVVYGGSTENLCWQCRMLLEL